jgi:hypothetical protein
MIIYYAGFVVYVIICLVVASYGIGRRIGMTGFFLIGLVFTPIVSALVLLIAGQKSTAPPYNNQS